MTQRDVYEREMEYQVLRRLMKNTEEETARPKSMLAAALQEELTPRQAVMVRMYYLEQHTMRDIARELGVNVSTVSRTLASARVKLKRCLKYTSRALLNSDR